MLLRVLFLCAGLAALGETILEASAALAAASLHRQAIAVARAAFADAAASAESGIAAAIASGESPAPPLPSVAPECAGILPSGCVLTASATLALVSPSPSPCPSGGCSLFLQGNDDVDEGRADVAIHVTVANAAGSVLATRDGAVLFRTLKVAPYVVPAGGLDATISEPAGAGDSGGIVPHGGSAGTLIDVVYQNASTGATMPANVWTGLPASALLARDWTP